MIVIRIRSSGYNGPRISLAQIKLSLCHCYSCLSPQVTSNDKTPTVISSALEKHNQDPKQASRYELIQLLPEGKGKDVKKNELSLSSALLNAHYICGQVLSFGSEFILLKGRQKLDCLKNLIYSCGSPFGTAQASFDTHCFAQRHREIIISLLVGRMYFFLYILR